MSPNWIELLVPIVIFGGGIILAITVSKIGIELIVQNNQKK